MFSYFYYLVYNLIIKECNNLTTGYKTITIPIKYKSYQTPFINNDSNPF